MREVRGVSYKIVSLWKKAACFGKEKKLFFACKHVIYSNIHVKVSTGTVYFCVPCMKTVAFVTVR
jgi:hypothetical protein